MAEEQSGLGRFSLGVGDRFSHEAEAQLAAFAKARAEGVVVTPVWNKSDREHQTVGSRPADLRAAADAAVAAWGWNEPYFVDADHIGTASVDRYLHDCDYFTLDVAASIGRRPTDAAIGRFLRRHPELVGEIEVDGADRPLELTRAQAEDTAGHYLEAVAEAGRLYRHIHARRAGRPFITEISMDETDRPQTPAELLLILAAVADEGIPAATIAPRFSGRFNKGVDYVGDVGTFAGELRADMAVAAHAVRRYGLPAGLKLSVHSGSDKFTIFPVINRALHETGAGLHLKTSGTTWLEEVIGLAEAGGEGLELACDVYAQAYARREELCAPYANVIDIDGGRLPAPEVVRSWSAEHFAATVRHDAADPRFDRNVRQLLHVAYKIAAGMGDRFTRLLAANREPIARNVTTNIYERHLQPLFSPPAGSATTTSGAGSPR